MGLTPQMERDFGARKAGHGEPIQVLAPLGASFQVASTAASSVRIGPIPGRVVSVWSDNNSRFRFGDGSVVAADDATSDPLTAGQREYYSLGGADHIAVRARAGEPAGIFFVRVLQ